MQFIHQANIINFHRDRNQNDKGDHHVLGWRNRESQIKRYEALISGLDLDNCSLLDVGCGYADFKTFLGKYYNRVSYTGIELIPEFAQEAARRFVNDSHASFIHGDFFTTPMTLVDYVFSCGALSYRNTDKEYAFKMILKMWETSRTGTSFCMLDRAKFPEHPLLIGYNKHEVLEYCQQLSNNVVLVDGYLPDDFTIKMIR